MHRGEVMGETIVVPTIDQRRLSLIRCEEKLLHFCLYDAYQRYDRLASEDEVVTGREIKAANTAMRARTPRLVWTDFLEPKSIPYLDTVAKSLDLIDSSVAEYENARSCVERVYEVLAGRLHITDMAASKVCYLKRPMLIAISDSYIRALVLGPDRTIEPRDPSRGHLYARRGVAVMDAIRRVGLISDN